MLCKYITSSSVLQPQPTTKAPLPPACLSQDYPPRLPLLPTSGLPDLVAGSDTGEQGSLEDNAWNWWPVSSTVYLRSSLVASSLHSEAWHSEWCYGQVWWLQDWCTVKFGHCKLGGVCTVKFGGGSDLYGCVANGSGRL